MKKQMEYEETTEMPYAELTTTHPPRHGKKNNAKLETEDILAITGAVFFLLSIVTYFMPKTVRGVSALSELSFWLAIVLWVVSFALSIMKVGTEDEKKLKILPEEIAAIIGLILVIIGALIGKLGKSMPVDKFLVVTTMMSAGLIAFAASAAFAAQRHDMEKKNK